MRVAVYRSGFIEPKFGKITPLEDKSDVDRTLAVGMANDRPMGLLPLAIQSSSQPKSNALILIMPKLVT
jgi:hypothetical protein